MAEQLNSQQRAQYSSIIDDILKHADLESISAKSVRQKMQDRLDHDISHLKAPITSLIGERFDKAMSDKDAIPTTNNGIDHHNSTNGHHHDTNGNVAKKRKAEQETDESELSDVESEPAPKKVKKSKVKPEAESDEAVARRLQAEINAQARSTRGGGVVKKKATVKKEKKAKKKSKAKLNSDDDSELEGASDDNKERKGGFHKPMNLSAPLAELLCETQLSRPQTVKKIWAYVKERDLQDPGDKRQIRCDDLMHAVFKQERVHMFTMNKILAGHLYPVEE